MWCLVAALGVAVAIAVPSASYLFAIPCGVAAVVAPAIALRPGIAKSPIAPVAMLAPLAAAASVFFALAIGLTLAFEYHLCALTAATLAIVVAGAVPGWLPLARERMRTLLASCGIVWLGALALLVRSAPTSFDDPAPLAFAHVVDADRREERSLAASFGWKLPA